MKISNLSKPFNQYSRLNEAGKNRKRENKRVEGSSPEIEELAEEEEGPEVERRGPGEGGDGEERDELNELQEVRDSSHNLGWISASPAHVHPCLRVRP